jgi:outer membrane lipoprotein-sorting protein
MADLGAVLAALHGPTPRWQALHARVTQWHHQQRRSAAFRASAEERTGKSGFFTVAVGSEDEEPDPEQRTTSELWVDGDKLRSEESGPDGETGLLVRRDELWWRYSSRSGAMSNEREEDRQVGTGGLADSYGDLWEPWRIAGHLVLEVTGETEQAGRKAWLVRAVPRPDPDGRSAFELHGLGTGADEYELAVDKERGVLLRVRSSFRGEDFSRIEVEAVDFDTPIADEVFVFEAPEGVRVRSLDEMHTPPRSGPLHQIAAEAGFQVWAPASLGPDWQLTATLFGDELGAVNLRCYLASRPQTSISISQAPASQPDTGFDPHDEGWQTETHAGREMRVLRPKGGRSGPMAVEIVKLVLGDTRIELQARNLGLDDVIEIACALEPASTEPPTLGG